MSLPQFRWYGVGRNRDLSGEQCPVGVGAGIPVLGDTNIWLSGAPDEPGSVGWDACLPRICTCVWLRVNQRRVIFANAHFDHLGKTARLESGKLLSQLLREPRTLLAGDFNCSPRSEAMQCLRERFLSSIIESRAEKATFHDFGRRSDGLQIDDILFDKCFQLESFRVVEDSGPVYYSDHYPLVAEFTF